MNYFKLKVSWYHQVISFIPDITMQIRNIKYVEEEEIIKIFWK